MSEDASWLIVTHGQSSLDYGFPFFLSFASYLLDFYTKAHKFNANLHYSVCITAVCILSKYIIKEFDR